VYIRSNKELTTIASQIRKMCLDISYKINPRAVHIGGSLSCVDLLTALYFEVMKYDSKNPTWCDRDRFFLSKGHSVIGYYATLFMAGYFSKEILDSYGLNGTLLAGHPILNKNLGIEFTNGSLGMGLSVAIGHALAAKKRKKTYHTYVLMGDGECNEGSVWEAVIAAPHFKLDNLTVIVDRNGFQQTGANEEIMKMENMHLIFQSFGWHAIVIDGHDMVSICNALNQEINNKPKAIIANTIKGKGFSFIEGNNAWHHSVITKELYHTGLNELNDKNDRN